MSALINMLWIEQRKAFRSRMILWTCLGSVLLPLGISFLVFIIRNPEFAANLGLISAKADLMSFSVNDWPTYFSFLGQMIAAAGFMLFVLVVTWTFGREFVDHTYTDMLAVPVPRGPVILAKFLSVTLWSLLLSLELVGLCFLAGLLLDIPGGAPSVYLDGIILNLVVAVLTIALILPFAFFASIGRGYILPFGLAILILIFTNFVAIAGWGDYFPYAAAGLYSQNLPLPAISYWLVALTTLIGIFATYAWWRWADHK